MDINKLRKLLNKCILESEDSPDLETQVGSILVRKDSEIELISAHNSFVNGAPSLILPNCRPDKYEFMIHAEENVLYKALREGISTKNCFLINTLSPCTKCMRAAWQSGIDTIYFPIDAKYKGFDEYIVMRDLNASIQNIKNEFIKISLS